MTAGFARQAIVWRSTVVALVLGLGSASLAFAQGTHQTCLSGFEVSAGSDAGGGVTTGVTFVGIDNSPEEDGSPNLACDSWTTNGNGGVWTAKIDRVGNAGIPDGYVTVVGGRWFWLDGDDRLHAGRVVGGYVIWPSALNVEVPNSGCGLGVAQFKIMLSVRGPSHAGSFGGCLDDTHLDPTRPPVVFPPRIWGTLTIN
jgi:hypothetical protein